MKQNRERKEAWDEEIFAHYTRQSVAIIETQKYILFFLSPLIIPLLLPGVSLNLWMVLYIRDEKNI